MFLIYQEVSSGAFGVEDCVWDASPPPSHSWLSIFPVEHSRNTNHCRDGHHVSREWRLYGVGLFIFWSYWGFQQGSMKLINGVIENPLYLALFLNYLKVVTPTLGGGLPRIFALLSLTETLIYMNYRGLTIVRCITVLPGLFSKLLFIIMGFVAVPKLRPERWLVVDLHHVGWTLYLNRLFWNLSYSDSISTLTGEVDGPNESLPKALFYAAILVILSNLFSLSF